MKDIESRADIILLVDAFYSKVKSNPVIGYIFTDVAALDFDIHLPKMYDFWCSMLLGEQSYYGNPMTPHMVLSQKVILSSDHFDEWLLLFNETVDTLFQGDKATEAKYRAKNIAGLMLHKIDQQMGRI
jgi:hemoglobin